MSSYLLRYLNQLMRCLPNQQMDTCSEPEHANLLANDIVICCSSHFKINTELATACSLLFNREYGLLAFLRKCANIDQFHASKSTLLAYLPSFLDKVGKTGLKYCVEIKDVCVFLFNSDSRAKLRVDVLNLLIKVLRVCSGTGFGRELEPKMLMDRFYSHLTQQSKLTPTVLQGIYHLLGVIVETSPEYVQQYANRLLSVYFSELKKQMTSRSRAFDKAIINGCFSGLIALLTSFPRPLEEEESRQLCHFVRMVVRYDKQLKRYEIPRGGLELIHKHSTCFAIHLYEDYEYFYNNLHDWSQQSHRETSLLAYSALEAFFQQVSAIMCAEKFDNIESRVAFEAKFKFFLNQFSKIFQSADASRWIAVAVKGYGLFAAPCKLLMDASSIRVMFSDVLQQCEKVFFSNSEMLENKVQFLPSFIESLANISAQLDEISETYLPSLENLAICLIEYFPKLLRAHRFLCYHALIKVLVVLYPKGAIFKTFINKIVYQGLLRTCSHAIVVEVEQSDDKSELFMKSEALQGSTVSYKDYLPLWNNLLDFVKLQALSSLGIPLAQRQAVIEILYDEILYAVLAIIKKLDISLLKLDPTELEMNLGFSSDPIVGLRASNPKDLEIFINLVDFCRSLLPKNNISLFEKWIYKFGYEIISLSSKFPLISGFYKLLALCFEICSNCQYFKNVCFDANTLYTSAAGLTTSNFNEKIASFNLFSKAVKEIVVRSRQYKDDLLTACLRAVLALPSEIVARDLLCLIPAISKAFGIGPSYLPVANDGLQALEKWSAELPLETLMPLYQEVLPLLSVFLKTSIGMETVETVTIDIKKSLKSKQTRIPMKVIKRQSKQDMTASIPEALKVKQRIVHLLGNLGMSVNQLLIDDNSRMIVRSAVAWDTNRRLKFSIPFIDIKPSIDLDDFLPRVIELSCSSSDRQTKVAASELLHALVLYMLGIVEQQKNPMMSLHKKIIPALLLLACDVDLVMRQLFEPLTMQLIHWFSKKVSENTDVLLDALMDGVVNSSNSALRDFSARCIKEYLTWSIKQSTPQSLEKNPYNTKALLRRVYSSSLHPDSFVRLGAAVVFNAIFAVFREEEALVNIFILELLYHFIQSLAIAQKDESHIGTRNQCQTALDHIERIMIAKSQLLIKKDKKRRIPKEFSDCDLESAIMWLLDQCRRPEADCRHRCLHMVYKLIPKLRHGSTINGYFTLLIQEEGVEFFISKFEGVSRLNDERQCLFGMKTLQYLLDELSLPAVISWFNMLLAALDCYISTFQTKALAPEQIFFEGSRSVVLLSVKYFIDNLFLTSIWDLAKRFDCPNSLFTPSEVAQFNHEKCTIIIRIMNFIEAFIHSSDLHNPVFYRFLGEIIQGTFWEMFLHCILCPLSVGFDMSDLEVMEKLPKETERLLLLLKESLPESQLKDFAAALQHKLSDSEPNNIFLKLSADLSLLEFADLLSLSYLVSGYECIHRTGLLFQALALTGQNNKDFATNVFQSAWNMCVCERGDIQHALRLEGTRHSLAQKIISFSFSLQFPVEQLIVQLMDDNLLTDPDGHSCLQKGAHLLVTFRSQVIDYLFLMAPKSIILLVDWAKKRPFLMVNVLSALCDHIATSKKLKREHGQMLSQAILSNWSKFRHWWCGIDLEDLKQLAVHLLIKVLILNSKLSEVLCEEVFEMFILLLVDIKIKIQLKSRLLEVLPFFLKLPDEQLDKLRCHLAKMASQIFPMKSTELQFGSHRCSEYIATFQKILAALETSGSLMLLEFVSELICVEPKHVCEDLLQDKFRSFMKRLPKERICAAVGVPMDIFWNESNVISVRQSALERIAVTLLRSANKTAILDFFTANIKRIMCCLKEKTVKFADEKFQQQLYSKTGCFKLMHILYDTGDRDELNTLQSKVNRAFCDDKPNSGRELTQEATRAAHAAKKESDRGETLFLEMRRQYRCAAYNALIAIISCTQIEAKFFNTFLFTENIAKSEFVWDNLIDTSRTYEFPVELSSPLDKRKQLLEIRQSSREARMVAGFSEDKGVEQSFNMSLHHLSNASLAGSSLSEDVAQFDFTSSLRLSSALMDEGVPMVKRRKTEETKPSLLPSYMEIEMDDLNGHECMASLNAVIVHMTNIFASPPVTEANDSLAKDEMPVWMKNLHTKLSSDNTHNNVKLFLAKLIINNEEIFKPYARHWLYVLMRLVVSGVAGPGLNYFVMDVVTMLLSWRAVSIPQNSAMDREMATRLLEFLMQNVSHTRRDILRNNLEIIKTLIECWKDRLDIPTKIIYSHFCNSDPGKLDNIAGIQLLGIVVDNGLPPYSSVVGLNEDIFLETFAKNLTFKSKDVYGAAAEVAGMCLKHLSQKYSPSNLPFHDVVQKHLSKMSESQLDRFIYCLHRIQMSYPLMNESFIHKILFMLPRIYGIFRSLCLEIVLSQLEGLDNVYLELKCIGLQSLLKHEDDLVQTLCLQIVNKMLPRITAEQLLELLPLITDFVVHRLLNCRNTALEILFWIYENYSGQDNRSDIVSPTKDAVLLALADDDLPLRLKVLNFWSHESRLSQGTLTRALNILEHMYSPGSERHFLGYSTYLLLELTSRSPDYTRPLFKSPLQPDCKFEKYDVSSSWQQRHSTMFPQFVETLASPSLPVTVLSQPLSVPMQQLRATQENLEFTPTEAMSRTYNWLTQSSLDTFFTIGVSGEDTVSSNLLFSARKFPQKTDAAIKVDFRKSKINLDSTNDDDKQVALDIGRLRRRFIKANEMEQRRHARRNEQLRQQREVQMRERKLARESQVTIYRQYRKGDLPDIQISHSAIIVPLQALAQRDDVIAKILFTNLITGILNESQDLNDGKFDEAVTALARSLNVILEKSISYNAAVISAVQELAYSFSEVKLDVENLVTASRASCQQNAAIALLEKMIIDCPNVVESRQAKQPVMELMSLPNKYLWIKLAELNKSLGCYDVVNGIFMHHVTSEVSVRDALAAEAIGNYNLAKKIYQKVFQGNRSVISDSESDLWNECMLECLEKLNDWKKSSSFAIQCFDDSNQPSLDSVWDDIFHQEHYLPFVIRGKLKLILSGEKEQDFVGFLDKAQKNVEQPHRRQLLESRFSQELALLSIVQKDYDRAHSYYDAGLQGFLQDCLSLSNLAASHLKLRLADLQALVEMEQFLNVIEESGNSFKEQAMNLLTKWEINCPDTHFDVCKLDDLASNRRLYMKQLGAKASLMESSNWVVGFEKMCLKSQLNLAMLCAEAASHQNNSVVALAYLKDSAKTYKKLDDGYLTCKWLHTYCRTHLYMKSSQPKLDVLLRVWGNLEKNLKSKAVQINVDLKLENLLLQSENVECLLKCLTDDPTLVRVNTSDEFKGLLECIGCTPSSSLAEMSMNFIEYSHQQLKTAICLKDSKQIATAHLHLAKFCDRHLRKTEVASFPEVITKSLLASIKLGNIEAMQLFPRLLQLTEKYLPTRDIFINEVSEIPCWMFLSWIGQLVAILDKPHGEAIHDLVTKIAKYYPNALIYPFLVSRKGFTFTDTDEGRKNKSAVDRIWNFLSRLWLVQYFIAALEQLPAVFVAYQDVCEKLFDLKKKDAAAFQKLFEETYENFFVKPLKLSENPIPYGKQSQLFARKIVKIVDDAFGSKGCKLHSMNIQDFQKKNKVIMEEMKALPHPKFLKDYNSWLSNFHQSKFSMQLEIPGQYRGYTKPMPEYHAKIARFGEEVVTLTSMRVPKCITIFADDHKEYKFLVKGGEDLRQDQRIQQLFQMMNEIYRNDLMCRSRQLNVITYQVIPLNDRLGILEWVQNSLPLKAFLENSMDGTEKGRFREADKTHREWILKASKKKYDGTQAYDYAYKNYNRNQTVMHYQNLIETTPKDILKKAFLRMSASIEAYIILRNHFITSHAVTSISQYILGIGDRHLSNFMICQETGAIIAIDFGHAFGSATTLLPIPELMPIRLTPQFLQMMEPMREHGLLEMGLIHTMHAVRSSKELLLSTMDVFINEPSADWIKNAQKQLKKTQNRTEDLEKDLSWYPQEKVDFAKQKLAGGNSACIMLKELELGHKNSPVFPFLKEMCLGDKDHNIRSRLPTIDLDVEKQVACLLDHATDPHILGKTWQGWQAWI